MDLNSKAVYVLNEAFQALGKVPIERAICLLLLDKAYSIQDTEQKVRSVNHEINIPVAIVVKNARYVVQQKTPFTKRRMYERDGYKCVYCGCVKRDELTMDHIIPRNRWREESVRKSIKYDLNSFENCVTACRTCNQGKSNKLLSELRWPEIVGKKPLENVELDWSTLMGY